MSKIIKKYYNKIAKDYTQIHGYGERLSLSSLEKFTKLLSTSKSKVLDVGCGGGQDSKFLADKGFSVLGIDISSAMIKLSRKYSPDVNFKIVNVMDLPNSHKYNGIWCSRVFHNISTEEQDKFLRKLKSLLGKNGILYITSVVCSKKEDYEIIDLKDGNILKKYLLAKSFKNLLINNGFKILKFKYWVGKRGMEIFAQKVTN